MLHTASLGSDIGDFFDNAGKFFGRLAELNWLYLLLALLFFGGYLTLRSRAQFNALRAAYPTEQMRWRVVWGAFVSGYATNQIIPLGGGGLVQIFLTRTSIPAASYPGVTAALWCVQPFDLAVSTLILIFAFTQGVFPKPPDFSKLPAFDLAFFAGHPRFTLFLMTFLAVAILVLFAVLSSRLKSFWARVRQGLTVLRDRRRYVRAMITWQLPAWFCRVIAAWFMLDAFHIGGSLVNALLVLGVQVVAALVPFTPGGAGVQQALLLTVFAKQASGAAVAAFAVGQQIAIAAFTVGIGFLALVSIFQVRSFKEVLRRGKEARKQSGDDLDPDAGPRPAET